MKGDRVQILLVEDNAADVRLLREAVRGAGRSGDLHVAGDGDQALALLRGDPPLTPDLVLLDLNLPRKGGLEVLAEMRADPTLGPIPVIVLTTSTADADICEAYRRGANCYIVKPVDFDHFRKVVMAIDRFWLDLVRLPQPASR